MGVNAPFGAKVISVFQENFALGRQSHQGLVILFEPDTGAPVCVVHAGEIVGRSADEITVYKSLGQVVQDLATAWALYSQG